MERKIVFSLGEYYHIYSRGVEKKKVFLDKKDYDRFLVLLYTTNNFETIHLSNFEKAGYQDFFKMKKGKNLTSIGSYSMMPNHFHLLLKETEEGGITKFLSKLLTAYSMYFNKKYHRSGSLFVHPFRARHADDDRYLKYLFAYINLNPLDFVLPGWEKIGNFSKCNDVLNNYKYSSFSDISGHKRTENSILNLENFPDYFGSDEGIMFKDYMADWINIKSESEINN